MAIASRVTAPAASLSALTVPSTSDDVPTLRFTLELGDDYGQVVACNSYSTCRTSAQQALQDMQAFQSDRQSATVPASLSASDSQLGDSLSAGIAALQELITGMDSNNVKKVDDGFNKLNDSMLSMAKAESALGAELK